jgi:flagellar biosynthesis component FlhA
MRISLIGLLVFLAFTLIFGEITMPTQEDLFLLLSSISLFVMAWLYTRDKRKEEAKAKIGATSKEEQKKAKEEK